MKTRSAIILIAISVFFLSGAVSDVQAQTMRRGVEVRAESEGATFTGNLVSLDDEALTLDPGDGSERMSFPLESLDKAEWLAGQKGNFGWGALIGGGAGLIVGIWAASDYSDSGTDLIYGGDDEEFQAGLVLVPTLAGVGLGGLVGLLVKSDQWEQVPLGEGIQISCSRAPYGGVGPSIALRW